MQYTNIPNKPVTQTPGVFGQYDSMDRNGFYEPGGILSIPTTEIDWCGAKLPNGGDNLGESIKMYTSDELLELLNGMSHKLQVLRQAIIDIGNRPEDTDDDGGDDGGGDSDCLI